MNKIYRLVWSSTQKAWVVAGEFAGARGKGTSSLRLAKRVGGLSGFVAAALIAFPADAWVAGGGTSSTALDNNNATNTSINGGVATGSGNATAIGPTATSTGSSSTAIGQLANATAVDSIALGHSASSTIVNGIAIGSGAKASGGNGAMAIGAQAAASSDGAIAFGSNAVATNTNSTAIGRSSVANGYSSVSIGDMANTTPDHSTAIGGGAAVTGLEGTSIGWYANTAGTQSQALGYYANAAGALSTAVGPKASTLGDYSVAMGSTATTTGNYGIAVGAAATSAANSLAIGKAAKATGSEAIVLGENAATAVDRSIVIGTSAGIGGVASASPVGGATTGNIAIGSTAGQNVKDDGVNMGGANVGIGTSAGNNVTGRGNQAIGKSAGNTVVGNDNFATGFGAGSNVSGSWNVAQGINAGTNVTGNNNLVYGSSAGQNVTGGDNIAIGQGAGNSITTSGTLAMGWHANASQNNAAALGAGSVATAADAIALGSHSNASRVGMNGGKELFSNTAVASALGAVSVGEAGSERQITNVAGGTQSTDAVNVRQLQAVSDSSVHYDDNPDGTVNYNSVTMGGPIYNTTTHTGGTKITNVADGTDPSDAVNFSQLTNTNNNINNIYATGTKYFHANSTGADSQALGQDAIAIGVGTVAAGKNSVAMGVNAGSNSTAANSLMFGTGAGANSSGTYGIYLGQNAGANSSGQGNQAIGTETGKNVTGNQNVAIGDYSGNGATGNNNITIGTTRGSASSTPVVGAVSQTIVMGQGAQSLGNGGIALGTLAQTKADNGVALGLYSSATNKNDVALGYYSVTAATVATAGSNIAGTDYAFAGSAPTSTVSVGRVGSERTITNVAAGRISNTSTDAINGSQLAASNQAINNLDAQAVQYDTNADGSVNYNSVTMGGDTYNSTTHTGGTKITNVADGSAPSDAVNFSQLTNTNNNINNIYNTGTKYFHANSTGADSQALGTDAIAVGVNSKADAASTNAIAMGNGASATSAKGSVVIGTNAKATYNGLNGDQVVIGTNANVTGVNGIALGSAANVSGSSSIAIGPSATATGDVSTATGYQASASGFMSNASGYRAKASGANSMALGANATASTDNSVALGAGSTTSAAALTNPVFVPKGANAADMKGTASGEVSVGSAGSERRITNVAAGAALTDAVNVSQLKSVADEAVQYDKNGDSTVNYNSMTLGGTTYNNTTHTGGTKITNVADGSAPSDAVNFSQLTNTNNNINNIYATGTKYFHANSTGTDSSATGTDAVAIGMGAVADVARSVALGDGATTLAAVGTAGAKILGVDYAFAGTAPVGTVSIGSKGSERTLTNLAAGSLSATSTDGVNGSQLFATNTALNSVTSSVTNLDAGSVKYDKFVDGTVNYNNITLGGNTYDNSTHTGGTKITNVADGSDPSDAVNLSQLTTTNNNVTTLGDQVDNIYNTGTKYFHANSTGTDSSATGTDAVAIGMGAVADVARSIALGDGAKTEAAVATTGTSIAGTDYAFAGTAPVGTVSIGDAGSERTLTNLAAGSLSATSTDGVNGSQLFATNSAISTLDAGSVKYDTNVDGSVNYNNITLGGDTYNSTTHTGGTKIINVADGSDPSDAVNFSQLTTTNNNVTNLGDEVNNIYATGTKYFHANSTGTDSSATGTDAVAIGMGAVADVARSVALGDGSKTQAAESTSGTTLLGVDYAFAGTSPVGTVSIGDAGSERTLTNLAAGRLSETSTDGVNGSQLFATNTALNSVTSSVTNLDAGTVHYDKYVDGTVNYNSVTMGGDAYDNSTHTGGTKITNIADGSDPSDAVNFSQLATTNNNIDNIYNTGTKYFHANSTGTDSSATGIDAVAIGMSAVADVARSVALGDGAKTELAVATTGTTIRGTDYAFAGVAPVGTVSIGSVGDERTLTNMAAGRLSADSTDGVNGSQLFASNQAIDSLDLSFNDLDNHAVKYDTNIDGTVNYNNITLGGDTYNSTTHTGGTKITNVADGTDPSDAVNFSQLTETNSSINNIYNTGTKYFHANSTGADSSATGLDAVAIGMGAVADVARSVALGDGATTDEVVATAGTTLRGTDYAFAGAAPIGTVSIGSVGLERTLTNMAAGRLSADSTDGVNGSQLFATNQALNSLDISFTDLDNHAVKYDTNVDGTVNYNSVTMGGDTYNSTTHTGGTKITNVADGSAPSDAVNFSQLTETNNSINNIYSNGTKYFHANSTGADSSAMGADAVAIGQSAAASAMNSIAIGNGAEASTDNSVALGNGAKTQAAVGTSGITLQGQNYAFAGTAPVGTVSVGDVGEERTITNVAAGQVTATSTDAVNGSQLYAVADAVNNISGDITNLDNRSVKYDTNVDGTTNYNKITLAGDSTTITNVAAGTQDSDAVNFAQLEVVSTQVTNISNGTDGMFQVNNTSDLPKPTPTGKDSTAGGAGAVASGDNSVALGSNSSATASNSVALGSNSVADRDNTVSMGSAGHERQITNVAAGTSGTDAVNVNQLKSGIADANQYTDNKFGDLKNLVDGNKDKLSAGIAGAMAMASLPQPYAPGASMVSMGGGTYQNQSAVALGVSAISDNGKWVTKLSGTTNSQGDLGAAVGVGYQW